MTGERESLNHYSQGTLSRAHGEKSFSPALDSWPAEKAGPEMEVTVVNIKWPRAHHIAHKDSGPQSGKGPGPGCPASRTGSRTSPGPGGVKSRVGEDPAAEFRMSMS